ncbi:hydroxymethylbilane synthase [Rehaibacterium terrae]|jgi:hydroxymethylbilane synthase|uniref:Porphobilinogen deaminase n=1 Tax=Rehaibacterium terrae TaxID=1341696 RepID=A0A7W8DDY6_9GAMM|nr:hydroxymethylbilane synthase [Rehaibacterium terrae]MBB5015405.1 hydroxymethylbilane synthase [Rehaibacterium terrae]
MPTLRLATRKSALALWQTEHVAARLRRAHPDLDVQLVPMSTRGDEVLDRSLAAIGGKGLFLKELEVAMLEGRADAAVHSLKDVPMQLEAPFALAAVLERADPFDAFVSNRYDTLAALPRGSRVGTSSLRRQAQLRAVRPDLRIADLRGNVNTRLAKLDADEYDAIVLACAGLQRLGFDARIRQRLVAPAWVPAVAQGAIAIECRADDAATWSRLAALAHAPTRTCVDAERAMNLALHGSCHVPVAGHATLDGARLHLLGLVGSAIDGRIVRAEAEGPADDPQALGRRVAEALRAQGADGLIAASAG